jgi:hypothetical protein
MTSPRHAESTAQGRYYTHPVTHQQLVSVTNVLSVGCAKPALVPWAGKIVAEKTWTVLPRLVSASRAREDCRPAPIPKNWLPCGKCFGCLTRELKGEVTVARDKAADLGTRIHALAEAHLLSRPMPPDEEAAPYVKQYERFLADFDIDLTRDVEATELTVANPALGYAGTLDILLQLRLDGFSEGKVKLLPDNGRALWLIDLKTSATRPATSTYPEYALQLAALRHANEVWLPDDTVAPMPRGITGAACLNLRKTTYALIPLPTGTAEFAAFKGSLALTNWMHSGVTKDARPIETTADFRPKGRAKKTTTTTPKAA